MAYDPSERGAYPVGVQTLELVDSDRGDRKLAVELWYPAVDTARGADLDDAGADRFSVIAGFPPSVQAAVRDAPIRLGQFPLIVFSHGWGSHRRQSTFLATHLASHGYVVVAPDHTGNTVVELMSSMSRPRTDDVAVFDSAIEHRPRDVSFLLDEITRGIVPQLSSVIARGKVGMFGHSFGGWTTLASLGRESRLQVAMLLAPAGGQGRQSGRLFDEIEFELRRVVPTLYVVAERDSILPLAGMDKLYAASPDPKRMVVIENADHLHFCDDAERTHELFRMLPHYGNLNPGLDVPPFSELVAEKPTHAALRALACAHMDAFLKQKSEASAYLSRDLGGFCREEFELPVRDVRS